MMVKSWHERRKAIVWERSKRVRTRVELAPTEARIPAAGPTSAAVKVVKADVRALIDAALAERRPT